MESIQDHVIYCKDNKVASSDHVAIALLSAF
jgi:hypothetical protein